MRININPLWIAAFAILIGAILYFPLRKSAKDKAQAQIESAIIIERIDKVLKVVSVEAHYSELFTYNKALYDLPGFRKKAIIQVKGKVLVGYDLDSLDVNYDVDAKTLRIDKLPEAKILAIDADAQYLDMEQGLFYKFTKEEMTSISKLSKDLIRDKALKSNIKASADEQQAEMLGALLSPLIENGWEVYINGRKTDFNSIKTSKD